MILSTMLVWATRGRATGLWQGAYAIGLFVSGATFTLMARALGNGDLLKGMLPAFSRLGSVCLIAALIALVATFVWKRSAAQVATA